MLHLAYFLNWNFFFFFKKSIHTKNLTTRLSALVLRETPFLSGTGEVNDSF